MILKKYRFYSLIRLNCFFIAIFFTAIPSQAESFQETIPVYGVIKPAQITTAISVNHGVVAKMNFSVGDDVHPGSHLLSVIERETTRSYRSTIRGKVAKLHVTPGAALTPGMPLVTVINPSLKLLEIALSPKEATHIKVGSNVFSKNSNDIFGKINKVSPLVDPDTGAVTAYIKSKNKINQFIGDVIPLEVAIRSIDDCLVKPIDQIDQYMNKYKIEAISGVKACLTLRGQ